MQGDDRAYVFPPLDALPNNTDMCVYQQQLTQGNLLK